LKTFFVLFLITIPNAVAAVKLVPSEVEILPNGLKVAWFLDDRLPLVDLSVVVQAGYRDDPRGKSGTAELVGSLLDRGVSGMSAQEVASRIEKIGGSRTISLSNDTFNVGVHGLTSDADSLLDILEKLVTRAEFPANEVRTEQGRLVERWSRFEEYSEAILSLAYRRWVTAGTSYFRGNIYSISELNSVKREDLLNYYKNYFIPKNSILVVVGKINRIEFRDKIMSTFGKWQAKLVDTINGSVRNRVRYSGKKVENTPILLVNRPQLSQAQIRLGSPTLLIRSTEHYALRIANAVLGELFNSRLNAIVRDQFGLTYSINSGFSYDQEFSEFSVSTATSNTTVGPLVKKVLETLNDFSSHPPTEEEVKLAKEYLIGDFSVSNSTMNAVAGRWITGEIFKLGDGYLNGYIPKITEVSSRDVGIAVKKLFDPDRMVIVVAGDVTLIQESFRGVGMKSFKQVSASDLK
jgi:zinc protease